jgi:exosortase C (VPDSG-CTERM-specific)
VTTPPTEPEGPAFHSNNRRNLFIASALLLLCFAAPLVQLVRFALNSELYSYIILIPFISGYLVWAKPTPPAPSGKRLSPVWALVFFFAGTGMLVTYFLSLFSADPQTPQDILALAIYSLVLLFTGICCWFLNQPTLRAMAFPLGFLVFLAPLPVVVETGLETFLQHGSSIVAQAFFQIIGTPVFRDVTVFHLPGFTMQVAPECSGIHSTVALFITSLVAGQVLLRSTRNQAILTLAVLPIALLRNALRVTTIGELCVRIGPEMIDSYIHRHGGPIFFIISLVPFSLLLFLLIKTDRKGGYPAKTTA